MPNAMTRLSAASAIMLITCAAASAEPANSNWSGFYAGAHGGYGWTKLTVNGDEDNEKMDLKGGLGGLHAGYLWQWQQLVAGVEGDFSWSSIDFSERHTDGSEIGDVSVKNDWFASIRGRLGYDLGPALLYGTAGVAWTDWSVDSKFHDLGSGETNHFTGGSTGSGWVIGGGGELKITENILVRLESLHYRFDNLDIDGKVNGAPADEGATTVDEKVTVVRGGVAWRF